MRAIELIGDVDDQHRLRAEVPPDLQAGPVRLILLVPDEDDAGGLAWSRGVAREWAAELSDPREDIYSLENEQPANVSG